MSKQVFLTTITITIIVSIGIFTTPHGAEGAALVRAFRVASVPQQTSLTEIISALNLTNFLQNSTPQLQQSVTNLTQFLQTNSSSTAIQQALKNVTASSANINNLTTRLQQFLGNLQNNSNLTSGLNSTVANIQNLLKNSTNANQLQTLINRFGSNNITNSVTNLQTQVSNFTNTIQSGLQGLLKQQPNLLSSINSLNQSLSSGQLNQTLVQVVTNLTNGQSLSLPQALSSLQQALNPTGTGSSGSTTTNPIQQIIKSIQNAITNFQNQLQTMFGSLIPGLGNSTGSTGTLNLFGMH